LYLEALRSMSPAQKLQRVADLYAEALRRKAECLSLVHPEWPEERLDFEARRWLSHHGP